MVARNAQAVTEKKTTDRRRLSRPRSASPAIRQKAAPATAQTQTLQKGNFDNQAKTVGRGKRLSVDAKARQSNRVGRNRTPQGVASSQTTVVGLSENVFGQSDTSFRVGVRGQAGSRRACSPARNAIAGRAVSGLIASCSSSRNIVTSQAGTRSCSPKTPPLQSTILRSATSGRRLTPTSRVTPLRNSTTRTTRTRKPVKSSQSPLTDQKLARVVSKPVAGSRRKEMMSGDRPAQAETVALEKKVKELQDQAKRDQVRHGVALAKLTGDLEVCVSTKISCSSDF